MAPFAIDVAGADVPDVQALARFFSSQTGESAESIQPRLEWQGRNPSRSPGIPGAICARLPSGDIGGAMLCIPHRLERQSVRHTALMSSGFYVDPSIRGAGLQIFLAYRALSARHPLYATTANALSERLWRSAGGTPLARTEYEWLHPIAWPPVVEEMLVRRAGSAVAPLARIAALAGHLRREKFSGATGELTRVDRPEDAVVQSASSDLQPVRDAAFIRWRFFEVPQADGVVYRYRDGATGADGFVAVTSSRRGYRRQLRTISLADTWGTIPAAAFPALLAAIGRRHRASADLIAIRCVPDAYEREVERAGFRRRGFEYPIGWCLDPHGVLGPGPVLMPPAATELV
jgi:hypothetical protein